MIRWSALAVAAAACGSDPTATPVDATTVVASASPIRINEVMPANVASCTDQLGGHGDWVELYNPSDAAIDLGGYTITDDLAVPLKSTLLPGMMVPAHGYLMLWCDDDVEQGTDHVAFKLSATGESLALFDPGVAMVDLVEWPAMADDAVYARVPDGNGGFATCATATCGATNGAACGAP